MIAGTYAHRFSGIAMVQGIPCFLVGVGTMTIEAGGAISGVQTSSATQLMGEGAVIEVGEFDLVGAMQPAAGGTWKAAITFTMTGGNGNGPASQVLNGTFTLVPAGGTPDPTEKLWLISTGARNETDQADADEVVSGEAVRIAKAD